ncbi:MAG TPA: TerB family tellurite resistance protein [Chryseosolibacter sp.]|nr:TerB family tellurite resistance protein [Chryseosolibacter sp.]
MNYNTIITRLYFLLIYADGNVNDKEIRSAKQMLKAESISEGDFHAQLDQLKSRDHETLLTECIESIKKLDRTEQIRIVAWLCVLANADGFMDRDEWQLIYRIYHKELGLPLNEIFTVQKELNRLVWMRSTQEVD